MEQKTVNTKTVRQRLGGLITEMQYTDNLFLIEKNGDIVGGLVSTKFLEKHGVKINATTDTPEKTPSKPKATDGKAK